MCLFTLQSPIASEATRINTTTPCVVQSDAGGFIHILFNIIHFGRANSRNPRRDGHCRLPGFESGGVQIELCLFASILTVRESILGGAIGERANAKGCAGPCVSRHPIKFLSDFTLENRMKQGQNNRYKQVVTNQT